MMESSTNETLAPRSATATEFAKGNNARPVEAKSSEETAQPPKPDESSTKAAGQEEDAGGTEAKGVQSLLARLKGAIPVAAPPPALLKEKTEEGGADGERLLSSEVQDEQGGSHCSNGECLLLLEGK